MNVVASIRFSSGKRSPVRSLIWDIIQFDLDYTSYDSEVYAPMARHGVFPDRGSEQYNVKSKYLDTYQVNWLVFWGRQWWFNFNWLPTRVCVNWKRLWVARCEKLRSARQERSADLTRMATCDGKSASSGIWRWLTKTLKRPPRRKSNRSPKRRRDYWRKCPNLCRDRKRPRNRDLASTLKSAKSPPPSSRSWFGAGHRDGKRSPNCRGEWTWSRRCDRPTFCSTLNAKPKRRKSYAFLTSDTPKKWRASTNRKSPRPFTRLPVTRCSSCSTFYTRTGLQFSGDRKVLLQTYYRGIFRVLLLGYTV